MNKILHLDKATLINCVIVVDLEYTVSEPGFSKDRLWYRLILLSPASQEEILQLSQMCAHRGRAQLGNVLSKRSITRSHLALVIRR